MTNQELIARIEQLTQENKKLRTNNQQKTNDIAHLLSNVEEAIGEEHCKLSAVETVEEKAITESAIFAYGNVRACISGTLSAWSKL